MLVSWQDSFWQPLATALGRHCRSVVGSGKSSQETEDCNHKSTVTGVHNDHNLTRVSGFDATPGTCLCVSLRWSILNIC